MTVNSWKDVKFKEIILDIKTKTTKKKQKKTKALHIIYTTVEYLSKLLTYFAQSVIKPQKSNLESKWWTRLWNNIHQVQTKCTTEIESLENQIIIQSCSTG